MSSGTTISAGSESSSANARATRVFVIDRDVVMQERIRRLIEEEGLTCCGEASDDDDAVERICQSAPHVVLASLPVSAHGSLDLIRRIKAAAPGTPVLVFAMEDARTHGGRAIRAGASAYVMKDDDGEKLIAALHRLSPASVVRSPS